MKKWEYSLGFIVLILAIVLGTTFLANDLLVFRLFVGMALGYVLSRGYTGFAGSVNRAYRTGSTRLMRTMTMMFFLTALLSVAFLFNADAASYDLWVNPINFGLIVGGILFGFGMTFSSCCASGVLTDIASSPIRALITLVFFCFGVFIGFPIQNSASWITDSWLTTETGSKLYGGVYLPDLFQFDGFQGYLGALIVTGLLCGLVIYLAYRYEQKRKEEKTYSGHFGEKVQDKEVEESFKEPKTFQDYYDRLFVQAFSLRKAAVLLAVLFTLLMGVTQAGWGASTPYGLWFGKALMAFGVSAQELSNFTLMPAEAFETPFFQHPVSVQNFGIVIGALIFLLTSGTFSKVIRAELHVTGKQAFFLCVRRLIDGIWYKTCQWL